MNIISRMITFIRRRVLIEIRRWTEKYAKLYLSREKKLWKELSEYNKKTGSTGCSYTDYFFLYRLIRKYKPMQVLECGTGVTTLVIAYALSQNELETNIRGGVTSMEEVDKWADMAREIMPEHYRHYVNIVVSETVEDSFSLFRGMRYENVPDLEYDFVFIDGPKYTTKLDGHPTFDFDYINILRKSNKPVMGLIDQRVSTVFVLQQLLGIDKIKYLPAYGVTVIKPCVKEDLGSLDKKLSSSNFIPSFRVLSSTRVSMYPEQ